MTTNSRDDTCGSRAAAAQQMANVDRELSLLDYTKRRQYDISCAAIRNKDEGAIRRFLERSGEENAELMRQFAALIIIASAYKE